MLKAQAKVRELKAAGVPVSNEIFGDILRVVNAEAKAECQPVSYELTEEQLDLVRSVCEPCAARFTVKAKEG